MTSLRQLLPVFLWGLCLAVPAAPSLAQGAGISPDLKEKSLAILRKGLGSDQFWPAMHAAEALTMAGVGDEVQTALKGRLATEADLRQRCGLARELVRAGDRAQVPELFKVLANADTYGHTHACESLYKVNEIGDGQLLRAAMANTSAPITSLMAAGALARHGSPYAFQVLRARLEPVDTEFAWLSGWILGMVGDESDIPRLEAALKKLPSPRDQAYLGHALALLGNQTGKEILLANLQSEETITRADAAYMAGLAGLTQAVPRLTELLDDAQLDVSIRAAHGLLALAQQTESAKTTTSTSTVAIKPAIVLDLPPAPKNSRNSEGDFIQLNDGRLLFIYSHFLTGTGNDHDSAELRSRISNDHGRTWSIEDQFVARSNKGLNLMSVSLLRLPTGAIALFYLNKASLTDCRPEMRISTDEGVTWGEPVVCITDHVGYYVLNNSRAIQMKNGRLVLPVCLHWLQGTEKADWAGEIMCYFSDDMGATWKRSQSVQKAFDVNKKRITTQEPGVVELTDGRLMMFIRASGGFQLARYSSDGGDTWTEHETTTISSPVSPASLKRIPATGDLLLVWNDHAHIPKELANQRTPLTVAISRDEGRTWEKKKNLYDDPHGWYCYTAINFVDDTVLLGHCGGDRRKNGLNRTVVTRFNLAWLYGDAP